VMPHERKPEPPAEELKGGPLAKLAGMWVRDPLFAEWVMSQSGISPDAFIKDVCGIESKRELDHNTDAAWLFHEDVRKPYSAWLEARGKA
jgi:hypothetical protein